MADSTLDAARERAREAKKYDKTMWPDQWTQGPGTSANYVLDERGTLSVMVAATHAPHLRSQPARNAEAVAWARNNLAALADDVLTLADRVEEAERKVASVFGGKDPDHLYEADRDRIISQGEHPQRRVPGPEAHGSRGD